MKPLDGGIAKEILRGFKRAKMLTSASLLKAASTMRIPGQASGGTNPTETTYACKGFVSTKRKTKIGGTLVEQTDRVVCLMGATLTVEPAARDRVTIGGLTTRVIDVEVDAAGAVWTLLTRR